MNSFDVCQIQHVSENQLSDFLACNIFLWRWFDVYTHVSYSMFGTRVSEAEVQTILSFSLRNTS